MLTPAYKLTFTRPGGNGGGVLGAVTGSLAVTSGGKVIDTTDEPKASTVTRLTVCLDLDAPADSVTLVMGQVGAFRVARDTGVKVELGYADSDEGLTQVLTATVTAAEPGLTCARIVGHSAAAALLRTVVEQTYEGKTCGEIVRDLAGQAGVDVAQAEDGCTLPAYVADGRRNVHRHMRDLADLCGFDLYIDADGELVFQRFAGGNAVHVLEYGLHILSLEVLQAAPFTGQVEAWGESPAGAQGEDAWAWLTKDFSRSAGSAGSDSPLRLLERPALRTRDAAQPAAEAALAEVHRRTVRGRLVILGRPEVKLGDAVRLRGLADDALNATYQVRSIVHSLAKRTGFTTTLDIRSVGS